MREAAKKPRRGNLVAAVSSKENKKWNGWPNRLMELPWQNYNTLIPQCKFSLLVNL